MDLALALIYFEIFNCTKFNRFHYRRDNSTEPVTTSRYSGSEGVKEKRVHYAFLRADVMQTALIQGTQL